MTIAHDLMVEAPRALHASQTLRDALELFQSQGDLRQIPVVDDDRNLVGIFGQRELDSVLYPLLPLADCHCSALRASLATPIAQVMATDVHVVDEESDVLEVSDLMIEDKIIAIPVIDAHGKLLGMITYMDVMHDLAIRAAETL